MKLLKRVKWMELGKVAVKTRRDSLWLSLLSQEELLPFPLQLRPSAGAVANSAIGKNEGDEDESKEINWSELIEANPAETRPDEREEDFGRNSRRCWRRPASRH